LGWRANPEFPVSLERLLRGLSLLPPLLPVHDAADTDTDTDTTTALIRASYEARGKKESEHLSEPCHDGSLRTATTIIGSGGLGLVVRRRRRRRGNAAASASAAAAAAAAPRCFDDDSSSNGREPKKGASKAFAFDSSWRDVQRRRRIRF
jgi:hypothetical protein